MSKEALIVVDMQRDFCEGGSLEVKGGNQVAEQIAELMDDPKWVHIIASRDDHIRHSDNGGHISETPDYVDTWPAHCIQGSTGNLFHPAVRKAAWSNIKRLSVVYKGQGVPAYSAFEGKTHEGPTTDEILEQHEITDITVVGLALDYCVKATAIDAKLRGKYNVTVLGDYTAAVSNDTGHEAYNEMRRHGVYLP